MSSEIAIKVENLSKCYYIYDQPRDRLKQFVLPRLQKAAGIQSRQYFREFWALKDVSFEVKKGETVGVIGRNGSGKSTLLQMICGTLAPTAGSIEVRGRVAALLELGAGFNPDFTGRENVFMNAAILGLPEDETRLRFNEIADFAGIGEFIEQPVRTYSSGMYVRLAFAIAACVDPDILIIDEALSVGDGAFARKSFDRIMALKAKGATILFCSHSMYQIEAICDQALWLERGRAMMLDAPQRVTRAYTAALDADAAAPTATQLAPPPPAPNTGTARLLGVAVTADGVTGRRLVLQAGVSDLAVTVRFQIDPALPPPSIAFGLVTLAGMAVSSGSTSFDGIVPTIDDRGQGQVRLEFPRLPLMRGEYRLTVFLACENSLHLYDQALYCAELEVVHDGVEQGVVYLPHAWHAAA